MTAHDSEAGAPRSADDAQLQTLAGRFLSFRLAEEDYGLQILDVREIIRMQHITPVPCRPAFLRGVINLRGRIIPVVDLRCKFGMGLAETTPQSVIIVVQCASLGGNTPTGVLVDEVVEVVDLSAAQLDPPPVYAGGALETEFVLGIGKIADDVLFLLDIGRVLSTAENQLLADAATGAPPRPDSATPGT